MRGVGLTEVGRAEPRGAWEAPLGAARVAGRRGSCTGVAARRGELGEPGGAAAPA